MNISTELKALSWKEPHGALMLKGKIETRTRKTNYRGWVLMCASKVPYSNEMVKTISGSKQLLRIYNRTYVHPGYAFAIGKLVDCRLMVPEDEDKCFVLYRKGLYCHVYEDVQAIAPFPWKGSQGWRTVTDEIKTKIVNLKGEYLFNDPGEQGTK